MRARVHSRSRAGSVKSGNVSIATFLNSTGVATVNGLGSQLAVTGDFVVGESGKGTLNITAGGNVSSNYADIGGQAGSSGTVMVDGGLKLDERPPSFVGRGGAGSLTVSNGAAVSTSSA